MTRESSPAGGYPFAKANCQKAPANRARFVIAAVQEARFEKAVAATSFTISIGHAVRSKDANVFEWFLNRRLASHKEGFLFVDVVNIST